ncbi:unnamed protein product [Schistocephalus solidus]|uniref:Uncharacterized protein n=1 Tax=Schistocephalus solidus TaxID=70667 RepID=A0A183SCU4_SCHSO|nr:unnamed protein product [Schistocephalus solidus]
MSDISNVSTCAASLGLRPGQLLTAAPATGGLGEVEIIGKKPPTELSAMDSEKLHSKCLLSFLSRTRPCCHYSIFCGLNLLVMT